MRFELNGADQKFMCRPVQDELFCLAKAPQPACSVFLKGSREQWLATDLNLLKAWTNYLYNRYSAGIAIRPVKT